MADGKRWMIRGAGKSLRKAIKEAANAEGISIGSWVRRALERALEAAPKRPGPGSEVFTWIERLEKNGCVGTAGCC